jgi:hypothetical protein
VIDRDSHRDRPAEGETGDVGAVDAERVHEGYQVVAQLPERPVGPAEVGLAVSTEVVHDDTMSKHQVGHGSPPRAVVVGQAVDEDQRFAATGLEPGDVDVVTSRVHVLAAPCG